MNRIHYGFSLLGAGLLTAGGVTTYEHSRTNALEGQLREAKATVASVDARSREVEARWQNAMAELRSEMDQTRDQTGKDVAQVSRRAVQAAQSQTRRISQQLSEVKENLQTTSTAVQGIASEVGAVKTDVTTVRSDVNAVKTDVATAQTDINDTKNTLQRAKGDLGELSGLIATNSEEIKQLRALGDRNIYEFTLARGTMQKVGDIQVRLKKSDKSKNRFTLDVLADDKRVEKKDRTVNEPVQFYTAGATRPYEIVVNQVLGDKVVGYLATPKVLSSRTQMR